MSYLVALTNRIGTKEQPRDAGLAELGAAQHGVVATWQLLVLGFSRREIHRRVASGRLHSIHRGVYAVGHTKLTLRGRWMAAVLACGKDAALSHRDAAALHNLLDAGVGLIHVTAPGRSHHRRVGVRVHNPRSLHPDDVTVIDGIPVTSVARTLLDVAETEPLRRLERAYEAAERERTLEMRKVHELLVRSRGHRGARPLTTLIERFTEPPPHTRSKLERRFFRLCKQAGVPLPAVNVSVKGHEVDMLWREHKVIVELDSCGFHRTRAAFERDRRRDVELQLAGYRVLRFTWRRLAEEPEVLVEAIRTALLSDAVAVL